ncbi:hypothetical protein ACIQPQ_34415 [Streptomyces sp. NPDC091281]|uniref:hypothetical protein n=1 Tax=Streptomyces sp. NPDC091281 TaxID=3365985 RepID=UPI00382E9C1A
MAASLTPDVVQRLAYVRYLYREGIEQSRQPAPLRSRAITSFHDAVENYLGTIVQHLKIDVAKAPDFIAYWALIRPKFELPKKDPMKRLNDARVALKHNGTFPSEHQIEQARHTLDDFFTTVTPKIFGVDFDSIDMVDLLTQPDVARLLREAQTHADVGDYSMAAAGLSMALDALLTHYSGRNTGTRWRPFAFGRTLSWSDSPKLDGREAPRNGRLARLSEIAEATQEAMRATSLGIDYPSLARFRIIMPSVQGYYSGPPRYVEAKTHALLTADDYDWARHFVIESALRASRADGIEDLQRAQREVNADGGEAFPERSWTGPLEPAEPEEASVLETEL